MQEEVKHYKVKSLPTILRPNSVYYVKATSQSAVKTYITDQIGFAFPLIDLNSTIQTVTGTGVTGTPSNPIVDISTFKSSQLGNLIELSTNDGKLFVKPIISPDGSIDIVSTATSLELQLGSSLQTQIQNALQPGDNISELVNDVGYITLADIPFSAVSATAWTPNHTVATGNPYLAGTIVYYQGHIFQANFNNDSIVPAIGGNLYWTDLGVGYLIDQEQTDWLAVSGSAFIKNKPTNVSSFINDAGYLTSFTETDPVFSAWLSTNPLSSYATQSWVGNNFYPLNSNPSGYLTQEEVEEYASLSAFPTVGTVGVVYIALNTGLFYSWNGSTYVLSSAPNTGITGGGIINRLPKFTPNGTTIGSSNFSDDGLGGRYNISGTTSYLAFYAGGNTYLRLQRASNNRVEFILGNPGAAQTAEITASNSLGFELHATGITSYLGLKANNIEGLRVLPTGGLQFSQLPDLGSTSDEVIVRDSLGFIKRIPYPNLSGYVPYIGATANVNLGTYGLLSEYLELNTAPTTYTPAVGRLGWNDTDGTVEFKLKGGNVTLQIGQEQVIRVVNKTTPLINLLESNYQVCVISGATGQRVSVRLAQADNDVNSAGTLGVVTENINANQEGFITTGGQVKEINTTGSLQGETWNDGDVLYLSPTIAGALTNIKPTAPNHTVIVGYVEYAHAVHGKIFVKIDNGYELDELHNVKITSPINSQTLSYNSLLGVWENQDELLVQTQRMFNSFRAGTTSLIVIGNNLGVALSAAVSRTLSSTSYYSKKQRIGNVTAASAGSIASYRLTTLHFILDGLEYFEQTFGTAEGSSTSGMRAAFGISTNIGALSSNIEYNTLTDFIGICRLSTSDNWHIIHNDNVGLATTIDLGSNFPANISEEIYTYRITPKGVNDLDVTVTRQSTGDSVTHNITSNIPSTSVLYTMKGGANNNTNATAFGWDFFAITELFK